jgi:hypothetical protein
MHLDFSDAPLIIPQIPGTGLAKAYEGLPGTIARARMMEIVDTYILAFFDWVVVGKVSRDILEDLSAAFPKVSFEDI